MNQQALLVYLLPCGIVVCNRRRAGRKNHILCIHTIYYIGTQAACTGYSSQRYNYLEFFSKVRVEGFPIFNDLKSICYVFVLKYFKNQTYCFSMDQRSFSFEYIRVLAIGQFK